MVMGRRWLAIGGWARRPKYDGDAKRKRSAVRRTNDYGGQICKWTLEKLHESHPVVTIVDADSALTVIDREMMMVVEMAVNGG